MLFTRVRQIRWRRAARPASVLAALLLAGVVGLIVAMENPLVALSVLVIATGVFLISPWSERAWHGVQASRERRSRGWSHYYDE